jgi:chromosome partitioning protein
MPIPGIADAGLHARRWDWCCGTPADQRLVASALIGYDWVFIDTAPTTWLVVQEAIRAATMVVIPVRPGFFDLAAVRETVATARDLEKPYAVVINAAPVKREDKEAPAVALSRAQFERLSVPVWSGQISQRTAFLGSLAAGASAGEICGDSACKMEIARLWSAIERSVDAINRARRAPGMRTARRPDSSENLGEQQRTATKPLSA